MKVKCDSCGYEFDNQHNRCPRCNAIIKKAKGCESCKGCSLFKSCKG